MKKTTDNLICSARIQLAVDYIIDELKALRTLGSIQKNFSLLLLHKFKLYRNLFFGLFFIFLFFLSDL